jgi:hypothetical protein
MDIAAEDKSIIYNEINCRVLTLAEDNNPDEITLAFIKEMVNNCLLFIRKHKDYGASNISNFGEVGVIVRCNDKFERLKNLTFSGEDPNNESIEDNWRDISNYGTIGFMTHVGSWTGCKKIKFAKPS